MKFTCSSLIKNKKMKFLILSMFILTRIKSDNKYINFYNFYFFYILFNLVFYIYKKNIIFFQFLSIFIKNFYFCNIKISQISVYKVCILEIQF